MTQTFHWRRFVDPVVRAFVVSACALGIWESWQFERSERLYYRYTPDSIRAAIRVEPDCSYCYFALARKDQPHAEEFLRTALRHNPYDSDALIDLGLRYEADGDLRRAEETLLEAYAVDKAYAPRWTLANFYFRRDNLPAFWAWARRAQEMPSDDLGALFALCWRVSPDPKTIEANVVGDETDVLRNYISFLIGKNLPSAAVHPAVRLFSTRPPDPNHLSESDQTLIGNLLDELIAAKDATGATALWRELDRQHWIIAETSVPNNPHFARDPLPLKFDWYLRDYAGLHSWPGPSGLRTEFTGEEPEDCSIAEQIISLPPGNYRLDSSYHTLSIAPNTGIRWEVADPKTEAVLARSADLSSDALTSTAFSFTVRQDTHFLRLRLTYKREPGTVRVTGTLVVPSITIQPHPES